MVYGFWFMVPIDRKTKIRLNNQQPETSIQDLEQRRDPRSSHMHRF